MNALVAAPGQAGARATTPFIIALPKGRILGECGPLLARAGITPAAGVIAEGTAR